MKESYYNTLCEMWQVQDFCNNHQIDRLEFTAQVPMWYTDKVGDCIYFRVDTVKFDGSNIVHRPFCYNESHKISTVCDMHCDMYAVNELIAQPQVGNSDLPSTYQFWLFFFFMVISWVSQAVVVSVSDTICFELLGKFIFYGRTFYNHKLKPYFRLFC